MRAAVFGLLLVVSAFVLGACGGGDSADETVRFGTVDWPEAIAKTNVSSTIVDALGELNDPARVLTIVNEDLPEDDPVAYAFMSALTLDEDQLNDLESTINEAGDPLEGARRWARDNRGVWQPWVEAAESARES